MTPTGSTTHRGRRARVAPAKAQAQVTTTAHASGAGVLAPRRAGPRQVLVFLAAYLAWHVLLHADERWIPWYIEHLAVPSAAFVINTIELANEPVRTIGTRLVAPGGGLNVLQGCEGLDVMGLWLAALLAGPFRRKGRALGATLGVALVFAFNQVRLVSLFDIYRFHRDWFADAHGLWWPLALVVMVIALYLAWQRGFSAPPAPAARAA